MPFALVTIGLIMIVTGARGTHAAFASQVRADFVGAGNFTYWIVAIGGVGALGYAEATRRLSSAFMWLIIIAMLISNRGFFAQLQDAIKNGPEAPPANACAASSPVLATPTNAGSLLQQRESGLFGQQPETAGQAKFNTLMNQLFGLIPKLVMP